MLRCHRRRSLESMTPKIERRTLTQARANSFRTFSPLPLATILDVARPIRTSIAYTKIGSDSAFDDQNKQCTLDEDTLTPLGGSVVPVSTIYFHRDTRCMHSSDSIMVVLL
ncbi:hypothetical protein H2248_010624 [Termitomyces sp. 'cryptogamus']|nr:hypothetical protein H2248_010624 [Termitomyces sp. 'cryptogamus']